VLIREDGTYLYTFTSVVDDADMGVTHIIRGDDHVTNTGVQIALFQALDAEPPEFGHHNLLTTVSGEGLSKRTGALSLASLRQDGIEPMAVASLAALIGTSESVHAAHSMSELAAHFDPAAASKSAAKFDSADLLVAQQIHPAFNAVQRRAG
jgi:glutamyl-tRNA synthetase